jgi:hypothetical protein
MTTNKKAIAPLTVGLHIGDKNVNPLVFGLTVRNLTQKEFLQLQCLFPIGGLSVSVSSANNGM